MKKFGLVKDIGKTLASFVNNIDISLNAVNIRIKKLNKVKLIQFKKASVSGLEASICNTPKSKEKKKATNKNTQKNKKSKNGFEKIAHGMKNMRGTVGTWLDDKIPGLKSFASEINVGIDALTKLKERFETVAYFAKLTRISTAAQWLFNAAMSANPIGLMIVGVTALATAGVWLYKNFEPFTNLIDGLWNHAKNFFGWISGKFGTLLKFFGFGGDDKEKKDKKTKPINNMKFKGIKKAIAPIVVGTALAANPINIPQHHLNEQSLNLSTQKEINKTNVSDVQTTSNSSSTNAISKNYTLNVTVQNANSEIDIIEAVKKAIKDIEADNNDRSMEDM